MFKFKRIPLITNANKTVLKITKNITILCFHTEQLLFKLARSVLFFWVLSYCLSIIEELVGINVYMTIDPIFMTTYPLLDNFVDIFFLQVLVVVKFLIYPEAWKMIHNTSLWNLWVIWILLILKQSQGWQPYIHISLKISLYNISLLNMAG